MHDLAQWLADPGRRDLVGAWSLLLTIGGTALTIVGLVLTYLQARNARLSSEQVKREVEAFEFRKNRYDAFGDVGEAKTAIEAAAKLLRLDSWSEAAASYDEARKAVIRVRLSCSDLPDELGQKLKVMADHFAAFSNSVDKALAGKGGYPDKAKVLIAVRRHGDTLSTVQTELQRS